jgi:hypothetical protein
MAPIVAFCTAVTAVLFRPAVRLPAATDSCVACRVSAGVAEAGPLRPRSSSSTRSRSNRNRARGPCSVRRSTTRSAIASMSLPSSLTSCACDPTAPSGVGPGSRLILQRQARSPGPRTRAASSKTARLNSGQPGGLGNAQGAGCASPILSRPAAPRTRLHRQRLRSPPLPQAACPSAPHRDESTPRTARAPTEAPAPFTPRLYLPSTPLLPVTPLLPDPHTRSTVSPADSHDSACTLSGPSSCRSRRRREGISRSTTTSLPPRTPEPSGAWCCGQPVRGVASKYPA